jgi:hypothetical protein
MLVAAQAAQHASKQEPSARPITSAPKPSPFGVSAAERRTDERHNDVQRSNALDRRWGNLF